MFAHLALYLFSALWISAVVYVAYSARNSSVFKDTSSILPAGDAAEVAYYADQDTAPKDDQLLTWLSAAGAGGILLIFGLKRAFSGKNPLDQTNKKIGESIAAQEKIAKSLGENLDDLKKATLARDTAKRQIVAQIEEKVEANVEDFASLQAKVDALLSEHGENYKWWEEHPELWEQWQEALKTNEENHSAVEAAANAIERGEIPE